MVNLLPMWISALFKGAGDRLKKTSTGLFFIINKNDLAAVRKNWKKKKHQRFPERFCFDLKNYTLKIQTMLRMDKVRAHTLFSSLILLQKTHRLRVLTAGTSSVRDFGQSALDGVQNPAAQSTHQHMVCTLEAPLGESLPGEPSVWWSRWRMDELKKGHMVGSNQTDRCHTQSESWTAVRFWRH